MTAQPARRSGPDIALARTGEPQPCPRCGGEGLLSARVPHGWLNNRGTAVRGSQVIVLCPRCNADDPEAGPLILFFAVHGQVTRETTEEFASLLRNWAGQAQAAGVDQAALEAELQAWHRGELDAGEEPPAPGPYLPSDGRLDWPDAVPDDWP
ncbi:MAG: DUF6300 family protein [Streptosporangiaceae bacterium]